MHELPHKLEWRAASNVGHKQEYCQVLSQIHYYMVSWGCQYAGAFTNEGLVIVKCLQSPGADGTSHGKISVYEQIPWSQHSFFRTIWLYGTWPFDTKGTCLLWKQQMMRLGVSTMMKVPTMLIPTRRDESGLFIAFSPLQPWPSSILTLMSTGIIFVVVIFRIAVCTYIHLIIFHFIVVHTSSRNTLSQLKGHHTHVICQKVQMKANESNVDP